MIPNSKLNQMVYYFCQADLIAGHEAAMNAKAKKEQERQQNYLQSLQHERQKHERTVSVQTKQSTDNFKKAERISDTIWGKTCADLQIKINEMQQEIVHLESLRQRHVRVGKDIEEALQRKVSKGHEDCKVICVVQRCFCRTIFILRFATLLFCSF